MSREDDIKAAVHQAAACIMHGESVTFEKALDLLQEGCGNSDEFAAIQALRREGFNPSKVRYAPLEED